MEHDDADGLPGQDSFLDIVANMVGILVILVMVVGVRASQTVAPAEETAQAEQFQTQPATQLQSQTVEAELPRHNPAEVARIRDELVQTVSAVRDAEREIETKVVQAVNLRREAELAEARRMELNILLAEVEEHLAERRNKLDDISRAAYDVQRQIGEAQIELNELTQEQLTLLDGPVEVEEVESVPTPLARTVTGEEIHVRLRGNRLAVIPVDALLEELRGANVDYLRTRVMNGGEGIDVFGPIDEFRMRLSLQVHTEDLPGASVLTSPQRRSLVQVAEFLPTRSDVGEAIEQAMLPNSRFMRAVRAQRSNHPAVVVWVYPDSFADIRTIKRAMWEQSIPLAVRPLDAGDEITFSTKGSKAEAQ